ncbi:MAG: trypsin-like peptidase domain-containing protein [Ktedonobacteraceae bacterium]|nr:trypsin-like peptidase domain-containing protein [Ktedonobacteraceae bacterium]
MSQEENTFYSPYQSTTIPYQDTPQTLAPGAVGVLDRPALQPEQGGAQPPWYPSDPQSSPMPPSRRRGHGGAIVALALVLLLIFGVGLFAGWEFASSKTGSTPSATSSPVSTVSSSAVETQQEAAIAKVEPAVVELNVTTAQGEAIGSGVIIDANGDIVTNNHVVSGAQSMSAILSDGKTVQAQLVGTDAADDLAVVHIAPYTDMAVAQIGDSSKLAVGQNVLAIGNPLGITQTATTGIISALNRSVSESASTTISNAIQTDASINPGNSGGALINLQGQLIGIPTLGAVDTESNTPANGVGFAIPSNRIVTVVHQILQRG